MKIMRAYIQLLCIGAVAFAIPLSLLEDSKEMYLKSPPRSNKVKRAQEVIMFGNQQNKGMDPRGFQKTEKRAASDVDESMLDLAMLPNGLREGFDSNYAGDQMDTNRVSELEKIFQYGNPETNTYNFQHKDVAFRELSPNDPGFNDLSLFNLVEARRKREIKKIQENIKLGLRNKRELDFNPDELLALIKLWEAERRNKMHDSRTGWPIYAMDPNEYDLGDQEDNELDTSDYLPSGRWADSPKYGHHSFGSSEVLWPRQQKRFMVSKRRQGEDGLRVPLHSRLSL